MVVMTCIAAQLRDGVRGLIRCHTDDAFVLIADCTEKLLRELSTWDVAKDLTRLESFVSSGSESTEGYSTNEEEDHSVNNEKEVSENQEHEHYPV